MPETKSSFFRQGAWMVMATVLGGVGMTLVHSFLGDVKRWPADTYNQFKSLLGIYYMLGAPQAGIWTLFAQRTAMAITPDQIGSVARAARQTAVAVAVLMGIAAIYLLIWGPQTVAAYKLEGLEALWATWGLMLATFWLSIVRGILQGKQDFFAFGWVTIFDGLGRVVAVVAVVSVFHARAAGAIGGALLGNLAALCLGGWAARSVLQVKGASPNWRQWLAILIPLTASAAALQWLSQYDGVFLRRTIPSERLAEFNLGMRYSPGQLIGFAIGQFTVPLALVMFPKIARGRATAEKSGVLRLTLISSLVMGGLAAVGCTLLPWLPVRVLYRTYDPAVAAPLVPWFAWAMLAYTLSNVLVGNLLAHGRYRVVPFMVLVAIGFNVVLNMFGDRVLGSPPAEGLRIVAGAVVLANFTLLAVAAWFTRMSREPEKQTAAASGIPSPGASA